MATVNQINVGLSGSNGTGAFVGNVSPTITTPTLGVATATSINGLGITPPATGSTLTIADGKTLTANNTMTFAGTDSTVITMPGSSSTLLGSLTSAHIYVGNGSNVATDVAASGDLSLTNTGVSSFTSGAITSAKIDASILRYVQVPISNSQFLNLMTSPVTLVAAGGSGVIIYTMFARVSVIYGTTQTTAGGTMIIGYGSGGNNILGTITNTTINALTASTTFNLIPVGTNRVLSATGNANVVLSVSTTNYATGDSTLLVELWYSVISDNT